MLITCKNFMFSDLTWETIFCSKKRGRGGGGVLVAPLPPFLYSPDNAMVLEFMWICLYAGWKKKKTENFLLKYNFYLK